MNNAVYTLVVEPNTIVIYDGRVAGSRLKYYADGLKIFVRGAIPGYRRDAVHYQAFDICLAHHIALRNLKQQGWL
jgi:hypothetical protein